MHCYRKGNLGNTTLKQVPDPGRPMGREGKGSARMDSGAGDGSQSSLVALTSSMPKCCRAAHRLCSQ